MRFFTSIISGFLLLVYRASAETGISCNPEKEICNTITSNTFAEVMAKIAEMVAKVGLPIVVIMLIWSGFLFVRLKFAGRIGPFFLYQQEEVRKNLKALRALFSGR